MHIRQDLKPARSKERTTKNVIMYYEEKIIKGVLCCRTTPKGEWKPVHAKELIYKH